MTRTPPIRFAGWRHLMRRTAGAVFAVIAPISVAAAADEAAAEASLLHPRQITLRQGFGSNGDARSTTVGLNWDLPWRRDWGRNGVLTTHGEFSLGRWHADKAADRDQDDFTQFGFTPALRYSFRGARGFFVETGAGINVITPRFQSDSRRFPTRFNFGQHLGVGWHASETANWEVALRVQHYSNAGIREPNPGITFFQLQFAIDVK